MAGSFEINKNGGYFEKGGVQVMAFSDFYPAGHQSGITLIMHGKRIAANGDVRFEPTPGQWQPVPKKGERLVDEENQSIATTLSYPDKDAHLKGFNPIIYPDFEFNYTVKAMAETKGVRVTVDLDRKIPEKYLGKLSFNLELYPSELFGKHWIMDDRAGIYPKQPNGPVFERESNYKNAGHFPETEEHTSPEILSDGNTSYSPIVADDLLTLPYAEGHSFTSAPEDELQRFTVKSSTNTLKLYDGRANHNNGWFVLSSELVNDGEHALEWLILPNICEDWLYKPVIQVSQVGYHPNQGKTARIELDGRDETRNKACLIKLTADGLTMICEKAPREWGQFLRYNYLTFDFSEITEQGLYQVAYGDSRSAVFQISEDVYDRGVWQPVLEYFLPVQMCHMRVEEKYRVWHGHCHADDAKMAPVNRGHFDGYRQKDSTLSKYKPGEAVPRLNAGGWHDAGDFDLRVESQSGESYILALAYESFDVDYDATAIDQQKHLVEIHKPDGENDILQQIEHGALTVLGGYKSLGRLYRGIICGSLKQYVLLGDAAAMTDGVESEDDRWVFTENNPFRELETAAHLAAISRVMKGFREGIAADALEAAENLYDCTDENAENADIPEWAKNRVKGARLQAAVELLITTGQEKYRKAVLDSWDAICENVQWLGWLGARVLKYLGGENTECRERLCAAVENSKAGLKEQCGENPYSIPYKPIIYGAGWNIQSMAFRYYFLQKEFPDILSADLLFDSLNFILGCHPGLNTASFASGIGARSMTTAYGINRADWSYVPGGVVSGTALIQPDFPELLDFPYLWQQAEYVLGGGSSNFMFLVLAVRQALGRK